MKQRTDSCWRRQNPRGLISAENARELRRKPDVVRGLTDYWLNTERVLALNLLFIPLDEQILRNAYSERQGTALLTNDSMIVSSMRFFSVQNLATADGDFDRVSGITVFGPSDLS